MEWLWKLLGIEGLVDKLVDRRREDLVGGYVKEMKRDGFYLVMLPDATRHEADQVSQSLHDSGVECLVVVADRVNVVELGS